jgi:hypothetical protein
MRSATAEQELAKSYHRKMIFRRRSFKQSFDATVAFGHPVFPFNRVYDAYDVRSP